MNGQFVVEAEVNHIVVGVLCIDFNNDNDLFCFPNGGDVVAGKFHAKFAIRRACGAPIGIDRRCIQRKFAAGVHGRVERVEHHSVCARFDRQFIRVAETQVELFDRKFVRETMRAGQRFDVAGDGVAVLVVRFLAELERNFGRDVHVDAWRVAQIVLPIPTAFGAGQFGALHLESVHKLFGRYLKQTFGVAVHIVENACVQRGVALVLRFAQRYDTRWRGVPVFHKFGFDRSAVGIDGFHRQHGKIHGESDVALDVETHARIVEQQFVAFEGFPLEETGRNFLYDVVAGNHFVASEITPHLIIIDKTELRVECDLRSVGYLHRAVRYERISGHHAHFCAVAFEMYLKIVHFVVDRAGRLSYFVMLGLQTRHRWECNIDEQIIAFRQFQVAGFDDDVQFGLCYIDAVDALIDGSVGLVVVVVEIQHLVHVAERVALFARGQRVRCAGREADTEFMSNVHGTRTDQTLGEIAGRHVFGVDADGVARP